MRVSGISGATGEILVLSQRPHLFQGSLREVLYWPKGGVIAEADAEQFSNERIGSVLQAVGLHKNFVEALKDSDGLTFELTKTQLSGGEEQKLMIARVLLHKPPVLVLDEATNAMPEADARNMYELLTTRLPNSIIISIAHTHVDALREFHNEGTFTRHGTFELCPSDKARRPLGPQTSPVLRA